MSASQHLAARIIPCYSYLRFSFATTQSDRALRTTCHIISYGSSRRFLPFNTKSKDFLTQMHDVRPKQLFLRACLALAASGMAIGLLRLKMARVCVLLGTRLFSDGRPAGDRIVRPLLLVMVGYSAHQRNVSLRSEVVLDGKWDRAVLVMPSCRVWTTEVKAQDRCQ
jgi:hypothetical protein